MAVQTRRPGGTWSQVSSASSYAGVVANYASVLQAAQEEMSNLELENKVFAYKNGTLTYTELKSFLDNRLTSTTSGTQKELDLKELLVGIDTYENQKNRSIKKADLEAKYAKNGISAVERLSIERDLLQYYKEGTPEYSEQLSSIAVAQELAQQEEKNTQIAKLQAELSQGGLTTSDKISLYERAKSLTEKGSSEEAEYKQKVNELKEIKIEEDRDMEANRKYVELLQDMGGDGISNEENLKIVQELKSIYPEDSEQFLEYLKTETELRGEIAKEKGDGAGVSKEQKALAEVEYYALEKQIQKADERIQMGQNPMESLDQQLQLLQQQQELIDTYGNVAGEQNSGELMVRLRDIQALKNAVDTKQAVVIQTNSKSGGVPVQKIVPLSELGSYGELESIYGAFDNEGNPNPEAIEQKQIVTIVEDGVVKRVAINPDGTIEAVSDVFDSGGKKIGSAYTGEIFDYGKINQSNANVLRKQTPVAGDVLGASTSSLNYTPVPSSSSKSSSSKSSSSKSSSSSSKSTSTPTVSKTISTTGSKSGLSGGSSGGGAGGGGGSSKPSLTNPTKGKIPGTKDYGITEAVSSAAKKAKNTVKSILGNLFK